MMRVCDCVYVSIRKEKGGEKKRKFTELGSYSYGVLVSLKSDWVGHQAGDLGKNCSLSPKAVC